MTNEKKYDVVVWGATGFTGRLVAEYLKKTYGIGKGLKWAVAGRNMTKLKTIHDELDLEGVDIIVADSSQRGSLDAMTSQSRVICTTVGPYALYGSELVASCVDHQCHYCDLAGEVQWIRKMIDAHHEEASAKGVKIVNCCGFDSIPSDMGVYYLQKMAKAKTGNHCDEIRFRLKAAKGGFSGGTYASLSNVMEEASKDKSVWKVLTNPYGLNPDPSFKGPDGKDLQTVLFEKETNSWITPFVMAAINTKIVRRSHALSDYPYGKEFQYDEAIMTGKDFKGRMKATGNALSLGVMMLAKPGSFFKGVLDKFLPKPGEGPNKKAREEGFFSARLFGFNNGEHIIVGSVKGDMDPGYGSTSKMIGECAVCLAHDGDNGITNGGVLTPSTAMGDAILDRLQEKAGLTFTVVE